MYRSCVDHDTTLRDSKNHDICENGLYDKVIFFVLITCHMSSLLCLNVTCKIPNVSIALIILLTLPMEVFLPQQSSSKLKLIRKKYLKTSESKTVVKNIWHSHQ